MLETIAYEVYEARTRRGYKSDRCTPEVWDWEHAKLYMEFPRTETVDEWLTKFIGE